MRTIVWKRRFVSATCAVFSIHCLTEIHTVIFTATKFNRFTSELLSLEWETFRRSIYIKLKYDFENSEILQFMFCYNFKLDKQKLSHKHCDLSFCWTYKNSISNEFVLLREVIFSSFVSNDYLTIFRDFTHKKWLWQLWLGTFWCVICSRRILQVTLLMAKVTNENIFVGKNVLK